MNGEVQMVEIEDQEMYGRRYVSQTAISAVTAYICINKKTQKKFNLELHEPEKLSAIQHPMKRHV